MALLLGSGGPARAVGALPRPEGHKAARRRAGGLLSRLRADLDPALPLITPRRRRAAAGWQREGAKQPQGDAAPGAGKWRRTATGGLLDLQSGAKAWRATLARCLCALRSPMKLAITAPRVTLI